MCIRDSFLPACMFAWGSEPLRLEGCQISAGRRLAGCFAYSDSFADNGGRVAAPSLSSLAGVIVATKFGVKRQAAGIQLSLTKQKHVGKGILRVRHAR